MKRSLVLLTALALVTFTHQLQAQAVITIDKEVHDFGTIPQGVPATTKFLVKNVGDSTLKLDFVQASCGCTTPKWSSEPVAPGESTTIEVGYNAAAMGSFTKSITIRSNADEPMKVIRIQGVVDAIENIPVSPEELAKSPKMNLSKTQIKVGRVERNKPMTYEVRVKNSGKSPLVLQKWATACNCVSAELAGGELPAGETGTLKITYNPNLTGSRIEILTLFSNDRNQPRQELRLEADVVESLSAPSLLQENSFGGF